MDAHRGASRLLGVKLLHTLVWVVVAGAIFALYPLAARRAWRAFGYLHVIIGAEIVVLAIFRWRCPLTLVAERYTTDRRPNFDIFLPAVIARYNKEIFTAILLGAWSFAAVMRWLS